MSNKPKGVAVDAYVGVSKKGEVLLATTAKACKDAGYFAVGYGIFRVAKVRILEIPETDPEIRKQMEDL